MNVAVACDPAVFRPDRPMQEGRILRTGWCVARPTEVFQGLPVIRHAVAFMAARDPEAGVYVVTRYPGTGEGITFEAESFDHALARAAEIVPDVFVARGINADGVGIVIDEYDSPAAFDA